MIKRSTTCVFLLVPLLCTSLAMIICAAIFELSLLPGLMLGSVLGILIGAWYYRSALKARKQSGVNFRECINVNTTLLTVILFVDLFASVMVWTVKELF